MAAVGVLYSPPSSPPGAGAPLRAASPTAPMALPFPSLRPARGHAAALALVLAACGGAPEADPRADSAAAAAAAQARTDSLEAVALVTVDTAIAPALGVDLSKMTRRESGLYVLERRRGSGATADSGRWVTVDYTTWLADGTVLDDTRKSGKPQNVLLGHGKIIPGWEEGIRGMRVGGRRMLVVPPALGYGKAGRPGSVPRLATLVFDIELREVH